MIGAAALRAGEEPTLNSVELHQKALKRRIELQQEKSGAGEEHPE